MVEYRRNEQYLSSDSSLSFSSMVQNTSGDYEWGGLVYNNNNNSFKNIGVRFFSESSSSEGGT